MTYRKGIWLKLKATKRAERAARAMVADAPKLTKGKRGAGADSATAANQREAGGSPKYPFKTLS